MKRQIFLGLFLCAAATSCVGSGAQAKIPVDASRLIGPATKVVGQLNDYIDRDASKPSPAQKDAAKLHGDLLLEILTEAEGGAN